MMMPKNSQHCLPQSWQKMQGKCNQSFLSHSNAIRSGESKGPECRDYSSIVWLHINVYTGVMVTNTVNGQSNISTFSNNIDINNIF